MHGYISEKTYYDDEIDEIIQIIVRWKLMRQRNEILAKSLYRNM